MKKLSPRFLLLLAAVLSLTCAVLVYSWLNKADDKKTVGQKAVVVATMDITPGTELKADMLKVVLMPQELVQSGALDDVREAEGKRLGMPVTSGDQITGKRLNASGRNSFIGSIPKDMRAMTIAVDEVSGVAGFIRPADYIDIAYTKNESQNQAASGELLLQKVQVLAVGRTDIAGDKGKKQSDIRSVTLALDPRDAVRLRLAQQEGRISLLLRPEKPAEDDVLQHKVYGARKSYAQEGVPEVVRQQEADGGIIVIRGTQVGR